MKVRVVPNGKAMVKLEQKEMNFLELSRSLAIAMNKLSGGTNEAAINLAIAIDAFKESLEPEQENEDGGPEELRGV